MLLQKSTITLGAMVAQRSYRFISMLVRRGSWVRSPQRENLNLFGFVGKHTETKTATISKNGFAQGLEHPNNP